MVSGEDVSVFSVKKRGWGGAYILIFLYSSGGILANSSYRGGNSCRIFTSGRLVVVLCELDISIKQPIPIATLDCQCLNTA